MITYGSTTLTSYNTITKIEVYYYKSTSATSLSGGSWSTTKPTWENGKYIWQKIRTTYEGELENGQYYSESDPVNITGQQGATGTAAYSYKLNASDTTITVSKTGVYSTNKITFTATSKQGTGSVNAYAGRFKIETTVNGTTWTTSYTSSGNESSKEFTIPTDIIAIRCSLYQAGGTSTLLDIMTIPILSDDRPIATKTYSGLIGSANDAANASFYFAKIHPDNYTTNYKVKMKVRVTAPEAYAETIDIQFGGYGSTFSSFDAYTTRTGSIGVYYINLYRATQAGISTNHKGHALGIGLRSSTNPTSTSYKRTIIVDILELDGCTVEMLDTAVKYASIDGTGSTNYYGLTEMAVGTAGQNATNNTNTHYTQYSNNVKAGTNGIKGYTLIMKDSENTWSCFYSGAYKKENTGKTVYTGGFMLGKILYSAGAGAQTSDSSLDTYYNYKSGVNTSTIYDAYPVDLRYSTNCASTLTSQRPVYIVGTIENDGLFHLDVSQWWTQTEPTYADGKVYIYVGIAYSTYQVWLSTENPAYMFYNGEFILYDKAQTLQNINTLKNSLETQIDSKVETWCQKTNPASSWTAEERPNHTGDLWYYIGESGTTYKNNTTYQYNGETNVWSAYSANPDLFDKIDGKTAIYYGTTSGVTSAEEGDYLVDSENDCTYRWNDGAWVLATDYKQVAIDAVEIGGRNFLSKVNVLAQATQYTEENYVYTGLYGNGGGLKFPASIFEVGINYVLSFKFQKINGTLTAIGGHCTGFSSFGNKFVIDGIKEENRTYSQGHLMSDDTNVHSVEVYLTFNGNTSDNNLYIQPNRGAYTQANNNEFQIWDLQLEKGNQKTDWRPAPEDVENSIKAYTESIQSQVDGMAEIHYGTAVPTLNNAPASAWTDTATKDMHVDDLYYNTSTGYCYRFIKSGSTYSWSRIKDSDITAAATAAGNAQTTANNANTLAGQKRRIFVSQPTPPYEVGDLWVEGSSGDIKKCKTTRASGNYTATDWELASKYTDDTLASEANDKIDNLEIGGRNLFGIGSDCATSLTGLIAQNFSIVTEDGYKCAHATGALGTTAYLQSVIPFTPKPLENVVFSADIKIKDIMLGTTNPMCEFYFSGQTIDGTWRTYKVANTYVDGELVATGNSKFHLRLPSNEWHRVTVKYQFYDAEFTANMRPAIYLRDCTGEIFVKNIKYERGTQETDWTPAPEDTQAGIDTALAQSIWYATCSTAGATLIKEATITPATTTFKLGVGTAVNVKFDNTNSGAVGSITLNVNNTGAKNIKYINNNAISNIPGVGYILGGRTYLFVYDGTYWVIQNLNYNSNTVGVCGGAFTAGTNGVRGYSLIMRDTQNTWVSITTSAGSNSNNAGNGTDHAKYTGGLYFDTVMYEGSNANYASGASIGTCYTALAVDLRYSTNCGSTLIKGRDVYLVGTIINDLFYLDDTWWTQTLPTSQNDKVYIYLGSAYSTTSIYLVENNPAYMYYEGKFLTLEEIETEKAKKTATNYMSSDNTGIMVADLADGEQLPANATGKNVFITAGYGEGSSAVNAGVHIRNGQEDLASFGEATVIGKVDEPHLQIESTGIYGQNNNNSNDRFFEISQNSGTETVNRYSGYTGIFQKNATTTKACTFNYYQNNEDYIKADIEIIIMRTSSAGFRIHSTTINISTSQTNTYTWTPNSNYNIKIVIDQIDASNEVMYGTIISEQNDIDISLRYNIRAYYSKTFHTPSYTLGTRVENSENGTYSFVEGIANIASGYCSHAGGEQCTAEGRYSYAKGAYSEAKGNFSVAIGDHTIANGENQTVIGRYNKEDEDSLFIIGNGADFTLFQKYTNALTVDQTGNIYIALDTAVTSSGTTDNDLYSAITTLGWETDIITSQ